MLKLIKYEQNAHKLLKNKTYGPKAFDYHTDLIEGYLKSHQIRNHSPKTISKNKKFLNGWFRYHGDENRPLYVWEAMEPIAGRQRIVNYGQLLLDSDVANQTIRNYLGMLRGFFSYVLSHPYVETTNGHERIIDLFHTIEQPISEYDIPTHSFDSTHLGVPLDPECLYDFFKILREKYVFSGPFPTLNARNYAMVVLACETGLRPDELIHLDKNQDILFESKKVQTRFAKGKRGSGKRAKSDRLSSTGQRHLKVLFKRASSKTPSL